MTLKVYLVSNDMVPKALLPELHAASDAYGSFVRFCEVGLERMHNLAKIAAPRWFNKQMEMLVQKNVTQHRKGVQFFDPAQRRTQ